MSTVQTAIKAGQIIPVNVMGDGMEPEYLHGDVVLVDTMYQNPSGGGVFAFEGLGTNVCRCDISSRHSVWMGYVNPRRKDKDEAISKDEFYNHVIGRVVGHIKTMMIPELKETLRIPL